MITPNIMFCKTTLSKHEMLQCCKINGHSIFHDHNFRKLNRRKCDQFKTITQHPKTWNCLPYNTKNKW
jgi:hypothetical protein